MTVKLKGFISTPWNVLWIQTVRYECVSPDRGAVSHAAGGRSVAVCGVALGVGGQGVAAAPGGGVQQAG